MNQLEAEGLMNWKLKGVPLVANVNNMQAQMNKNGWQLRSALQIFLTDTSLIPGQHPLPLGKKYPPLSRAKVPVQGEYRWTQHVI